MSSCSRIHRLARRQSFPDRFWREIITVSSLQRFLVVWAYTSHGQMRFQDKYLFYYSRKLVWKIKKLGYVWCSAPAFRPPAYWTRAVPYLLFRRQLSGSLSLNQPWGRAVQPGFMVSLSNRIPFVMPRFPALIDWIFASDYWTSFKLVLRSRDTFGARKSAEQGRTWTAACRLPGLRQG